MKFIAYFFTVFLFLMISTPAIIALKIITGIKNLSLAHKKQQLINKRSTTQDLAGF